MENCETSLNCSPYDLLFCSLSLIPLSHYLLALLFVFVAFLYNFLELHFLHDLLSGFPGDPVSLTYSSASNLYHSIVSKCQIVHGRFYPTPWLSSPHLQTAFLSLLGPSPDFSYKRHIFNTSDGGMLALDWLMHYDVKQGVTGVNDTTPKDDKAPILVVIPGLTSDSDSAYIKHVAFKMAKHGWNVVVGNHRGLGGISVTSDCFYNAGWTEDLRKVIEHVQNKYPEAPIYAVGTSIGANILVKYLGEEGVNTPLVGAAAVCPPWDLLICDRFMNRRIAQKVYDKMLTVGLQGYAQLHHSVLSRLTDMDRIKKSRSIREFDDCATRVLGKFETVDAYYRHSGCVNFVGGVSIPLLCFSALDDPVCTREAIPWDECRANENIILATTGHGGHLAYYEGLYANSLWWVRAVHEFFSVLHSSPFRDRRKKMEPSSLPVAVESSNRNGPYLSVVEDSLVVAVGNSQTKTKGAPAEHVEITKKDADSILNGENNKVHLSIDQESILKGENNKSHPSINHENPSDRSLADLIAPIRSSVNQLSQRGRISIWLLAYIAIITSWPHVGSAVVLFLKRKFRTGTLASLLRR